MVSQAKAVSGSNPSQSHYKQKTFTALNIPVYRFFFGSLLGQMAAMNMDMVARSWFMYELTNSATMLGAVNLVGAIPMLTISLFGGVLADRMSKKTILIAGQFASSLVALGLAISITLGTVSWVYLFIAAFLQSLVMSLIMPARQAIIYELVGENTLMNAIALNAAAMNLLRLLAPAFAGYAIAFWRIEGVYYITSGLYVMGLLFAIRLPYIRSVVQEESREGSFQQLKGGLHYIRHNANVMAILLVTLLVTVLSMPYMFLLPIFTKDIFTVDVARFGNLTSLPLIGPLLLGLKQSSARQGLLISISGIGALIGSLYVAGMSNKRRGLIYLLSLLIAGLSLVCFSITNSFFIAMLTFIPLGLGQAGRMSLSNTLLQTYTEDVYRGRVMSVYMMEFGITNVGVFLVSILADIFGVQWALGGAAGLLVVISLIYLFATPRIRNMD